MSLVEKYPKNLLNEKRRRKKKKKWKEKERGTDYLDCLVVYIQD